MSPGQDFQVNLEARVSPGQDFQVNLEARVSLGSTSRFHRDWRISVGANEILATLSGVSIRWDFRVRSEAHASLRDNT